ncbi:tryptophanase [bacterium]|nr:MAG: tryptophanase [bacterium]
MQPEPFRIKMVEEINLSTKSDRIKLIKQAGYNVFQLKINDIYIDLLTDSGTSAMSDKQWAAMLTTKQAYAGTNSYYQLEKIVHEIFGFKYFVPVHQGRAGEHLLFSSLVKPNQVVPNNSHFDTTQANVKFVGGIPLDFVVNDAYDPKKIVPFKGNMDLEKLENFMAKNRNKVSLIMTTITNNTVGGQAVSLDNIKKTSQIARRYKVPFFIDACRFAENAYFIKIKEKGYKTKGIREIIREIFSYADGCTFSGKKDALTNIGGLLATNNKDIFEKIRNMLVITEGYPTYGGLACRELACMAIGLQESTTESYLRYRHEQVEYLWKKLKSAGIPTVNPVGGHAVFIDGKKFFDHLPQTQFPSQTLAVELYIEAGIRGVELGTSCFGETDKKTGQMILPKLDLLRLTIPRRVYTNNHLDYVAESVIKIYQKRKKIKGLKRIYAPPLLGHFLAKFERVS